MKAYEDTGILKIKEDTSVRMVDVIAVEKRIKISVNGKDLLSLYCTPLMVREFVVGFIHNEGLIKGEWCAERMSIDYGGEDIKVDIPAPGGITDGERVITSGCAGGVSLVKDLSEIRLSDKTSFRAAAVRKVFDEFQKRSEVYRKTGGVHSAALADEDSMPAFAEDIGRHNAVDKVIGYCLLENIPFEGKMMLASGRLSSEIVSKCAGCGIPVVVSRAAPTSLAVKIAEETGITVIGFMRGSRMNVYTCDWRITL
jgi:FdhD protein